MYSTIEWYVLTLARTKHYNNMHPLKEKKILTEFLVNSNTFECKKPFSNVLFFMVFIL